MTTRWTRDELIMSLTELTSGASPARIVETLAYVCSLRKIECENAGDSQGVKMWNEDFKTLTECFYRWNR